jgi:hypothetical protein
MFSRNRPAFYEHAQRLATSCEKYDLPYSIYEIPRIHNSISPNGHDDLAFTKPNFISFAMQRFPTKRILYLDADVYFVDYPDKITQISDTDCDFAIYNWLNDKHNEAYVPVSEKFRRFQEASKYPHYYVYSHHIGYYSSDQLMCSGGVQFYRYSTNAKFLLKCWHDVIAEAPGWLDDECLDYAFNNFVVGATQLKAVWLDKSYLRMPWWPHVKPVIVHPELPRGGNRRRSLVGLNNRKRIYLEQCRKQERSLVFPPDCIIDTKGRRLLKSQSGKLVHLKNITQDFWIY